MEAAIKPKRSYKKRKQQNPTSNPLTGVITRNKSRRYLHHCTRSGKIRPDPVGRPDPRGIGSGMARADMGVLVKDLRAHRVFSKPLVVAVGNDDGNPNFDCELGGNENPNLSGLVKCGLDVEGLVEENPNFGCKLGELENPNFDCELGEMGNPNLLDVQNPNFDCKLGGNENPNFDCKLWGNENPNFDCKLGGNENPNFSVLLKCGLDVEGFVEKNPNFDCELGGNENPNLTGLVKCGLDVEGFVEQNPNFDCKLGEMENPNFDENPNLSVLVKRGLDVEGFVEQNPNSDCKLGGNENPNFNLFVLLKCDSDVRFKDYEGMTEQNPNLSSVQNSNCCLEKICSDIKCNDDVLNVCDPNLLEKCHSMADLEDERSDGRNPNLSENSNLEVGFEKEGLDEQYSDLMENIDKKVNCKIEGSSEENPNLLGKCDSAKGGKDQKFGVGLACNGSVSNYMSPNLSVDDFNGRKYEDFNAQTTPPNFVMSLSPIEDSNNRVIPNKGPSTEGKKTNSIMKRTSVLKPCSRPRVFKALNSFSYRRLLPYLTELSKHTSRPLELDGRPNPENSYITKPVVSKPQDEKQVTTLPVCNETLELSTGTNSKEEKVLSFDSQLNTSTRHETQNVTHLSNASHDEQISSDNHEKLEVVIVEECRALQVECKTKEKNLITVFDKSSNAEGSVSSSRLPIVGPLKGILKKNPRGCRGICDCLNCALFRVNADKAFEFSRNQLLDTEQLLQNMMKEMANLRSLLQKSANGAESIASTLVYQVQVQEVCSRASDVEAIARNRLSQMNEDLYVHCRNTPPQRPQVNFQ